MKLESWVGEAVVIDTDSRFTYVGTLTAIGDCGLEVKDVLIVDDTMNRVPMEQYLAECAAHGFAPSRQSVLVRDAKIVSISPLADIIQP